MVEPECESIYTSVVIREAHGTEAPQMHVRPGPLLAVTQLATEKATSRVLRLFVLLHVCARQYASKVRNKHAESELPGSEQHIDPGRPLSWGRWEVMISGLAFNAFGLVPFPDRSHNTCLSRVAQPREV